MRSTDLIDFFQTLTPAFSASQLDQFSRTLRSVGALPEAVHGHHAPHLSPRDAAGFLIAIGANLRPSELGARFAAYQNAIERDQAFKGLKLGETLAMILSDPVDLCGVREVRISQDAPVAWIVTKDGREIRFAPEDARGHNDLPSAIVRQTTFPASILSQLALDLQSDQGSEAGWLGGDGGTKAKLAELAKRERAALARKPIKKARKR